MPCGHGMSFCFLMLLEKAKLAAAAAIIKGIGIVGYLHLDFFKLGPRGDQCLWLQ
jgi:hypothetical protein